ncbi:MAG: TatD family hydrolase [Bacteroidaceae bacterium]|nr:TatD family hydrolase [Bacteroidaceae bacterium]
MLIDLHAHFTPAKLDGRAIISLSIGDKDFASSVETCKALNVPLSIGLHPWHTDEGDTAQACCDLIPWLKQPQVWLVGEAGIDRLRGGNIELQVEGFETQARLAAEAKKPLITHCVKAFDEVIRLHKTRFPHEPWIIHGFRGKPEQARQLLREGFFLSFGEHYNDEALCLCPPDRLMMESDESNLSIDTLYARAATLRGMEAEELKEQVNRNIESLIQRQKGVSSFFLR